MRENVLYKYVWDDVQFAIDLRAAREKSGMGRLAVAKLVGYESGATIRQLEEAKYGDGMPLRKYFALCNLFELHPFDYIDMERRE